MDKFNVFCFCFFFPRKSSNSSFSSSNTLQVSGMFIPFPLEFHPILFLPIFSCSLFFFFSFYFWVPSANIGLAWTHRQAGPYKQMCTYTLSWTLEVVGQFVARQKTAFNHFLLVLFFNILMIFLNLVVFKLS